MPELILTRAVIETGTDEMQFAEQGSVDDDILSFSVPLHAAMGADFELPKVFVDLLGHHGLLHVAQQCFGLRKRQAKFFRPQRTALQPYDFLDLFRFAVLGFNHNLYSNFHRCLLSTTTSSSRRWLRILLVGD